MTQPESIIAGEPQEVLFEICTQRNKVLNSWDALGPFALEGQGLHINGPRSVIDGQEETTCTGVSKGW